MVYNRFNKKIRITGDIVFDTAFHIGSGKEGESFSDMGVLLDSNGEPVIPGSTLKGNFRAFAERLACHLDMTACLLDSRLSGVNCVGDEKYRQGLYDDFKALDSEKDKVDWLEKHTCHVCRLFGSPLQASRIYFCDGLLITWGRSIQIRDGVCIDRDTETARDKAKYDFEVIPKDAQFSIIIEMENPEEKEIALVAAALGEWENGFRLGGFTSRGLGRTLFKNKKVFSVDYSKNEELLAYLIGKTMTEVPEMLEEYLKIALTA